MGTIIVGIILACLVAGIIIKLARDKKRGNSLSCGCGCGQCGKECSGRSAQKS